ncbi:PREDICTED: uncharacterized protein LOC108567640 [Nicrophorus vespilloides]|uniref:Telomerase reverse transcriptase n=1 Tax=Nicrophorus vespilloides TaxID=110193 RepID=A0ABM1NA72_NICVS|nr:PREDICTED: uncharacterized protein LOC108567640 [Nicrophorus vespilloides]
MNQDDLIKFYKRIIPFELFGSQLNNDMFYNLLTIIATRATHECVLTQSISSGYDPNAIDWLHDVIPNKRKAMLHMGLRVLIEIIVYPTFNKMFHPVRMGQYYEIRFAERVKWSNYLAKVRNFLVKSKSIVAVERKLVVKPRGVLYIRPRGDLTNIIDFRPYVVFNSKLNVMSTIYKKTVTKSLYQYAESLTFVKRTHFGKHWQKYIRIVGDSKLFATKLDLMDCFSNISVDILIDILNDADVKYLSKNMKEKLKFYVKHQYVMFGNRLWLWKRGLLQGDRFSSGLCEVYFAKLDSVNLREFNKTNCFLHKTVDDYFFCSTKEEDVANFKQILTSYAMINTTKIEDNRITITYCNFKINLNHRHVSNYYRFPKDTHIHCKYKLWNVNAQLSQLGLLTKSLFFAYNNNNFNATALNTSYNNDQTILRNYYEAMVLLAFKFDAMIMGISLGKPSMSYKSEHFERHIFSTVHYYSKKLIPSIPRRVKEKIAYFAFLVVLERRKNKLYREMVSHLKLLINKLYTSQFNMSYYKQLPECFKNISLRREFKPLV